MRPRDARAPMAIASERRANEPRSAAINETRRVTRENHATAADRAPKAIRARINRSGARGEPRRLLRKRRFISRRYESPGGRHRSAGGEERRSLSRRTRRRRRALSSRTGDVPFLLSARRIIATRSSAPCSAAGRDIHSRSRSGPISFPLPPTLAQHCAPPASRFIAQSIRDRRPIVRSISRASFAPFAADYANGIAPAPVSAKQKSRCAEGRRESVGRASGERRHSIGHLCGTEKSSRLFRRFGQIGALPRLLTSAAMKRITRETKERRTRKTRAASRVDVTERAKSNKHRSDK